MFLTSPTSHKFSGGIKYIKNSKKSGVTEHKEIVFTWMTDILRCTLPWPGRTDKIQYYFEALKGVAEGIKLLSEKELPIRQ